MATLTTLVPMHGSEMRSITKKDKLKWKMLTAERRLLHSVAWGGGEGVHEIKKEAERKKIRCFEFK
jgi:hypothetical protein